MSSNVISQEALGQGGGRWKHHITQKPLLYMSQTVSCQQPAVFLYPCSTIFGHVVRQGYGLLAVGIVSMETAFLCPRKTFRVPRRLRHQKLAAGILGGNVGESSTNSAATFINTEGRLGIISRPCSYRQLWAASVCRPSPSVTAVRLLMLTTTTTDVCILSSDLELECGKCGSSEFRG